MHARMHIRTYAHTHTHTHIHTHTQTCWPHTSKMCTCMQYILLLFQPQQPLQLLAVVSAENKSTIYSKTQIRHVRLYHRDSTSTLPCHIYTTATPLCLFEQEHKMQLPLHQHSHVAMTAWPFLVILCQCTVLQTKKNTMGNYFLICSVKKCASWPVNWR